MDSSRSGMGRDDTPSSRGSEGAAAATRSSHQNDPGVIARLAGMTLAIVGREYSWCHREVPLEPGNGLRLNACCTYVC